ncbi:helix-turn-helix transcriptional regulator [Paenibacillus eucommiae]|uniref:AraC-like DNA-binding protein n=1 Tax=Paenibacillus eucommiae TaxID=1355755 RepID=A0ABS4IRF6_9BACL|nr:AraC family transcriptional regulator [Paenibacillus eucommiae]MBP1990125.1 AraC-like DNA-binding protein [Paenibacillus eucommiae]
MKIGLLSGLTPMINFASRTTVAADTDWGIRLIPDWQFFYVVSGEAALQLGPDSYSIRPGECVLYGPESAHQLRTINETDYFSVHFDWHAAAEEPVHPAYRIRYGGLDDMLKQADSYSLDIPGHGEVCIPHHFTAAGLEPVLMQLVREYRMEQPGYTVMLRALQMEIITCIVRSMLRKVQPLSVHKIGPALQAMRSQPERNWAVAELAELCGYHPIHFSKIFKEEIGRSPKQYMMMERISQAKQALLKGDKIEAIAERLGYTSIHYFSYNFKNETGLTPSEFRQQGSSSIDPK